MVCRHIFTRQHFMQWIALSSLWSLSDKGGRRAVLFDQSQVKSRTDCCAAFCASPVALLAGSSNNASRVWNEWRTLSTLVDPNKEREDVVRLIYLYLTYLGKEGLLKNCTEISCVTVSGEIKHSGTFLILILYWFYSRPLHQLSISNKKCCYLPRKLRKHFVRNFFCSRTWTTSSNWEPSA